MLFPVRLSNPSAKNEEVRWWPLYFDERRPLAANNNNNSPHTSEIQDTDKTRARRAVSAIIKSSGTAVGLQGRGQTGGEPHVGRERIPFVLPPAAQA